MEKICSLGEQILSFKSNPQIWSDTVSTIKVKNKNDFFFICQRVWKTVKIRETVREKSENFEVNDKWQPCFNSRPQFEKASLSRETDRKWQILFSFAKMAETETYFLYEIR